MEKRRLVSEVKSFSFNALEGISVNGSAEPTSFEFKSLTLTVGDINKPSAKIIRAEREVESTSSFRMDAIVRDLRGLASQEKEDLAGLVDKKVEQRLNEMREAAYSEGLKQGRNQGSEVALKEATVKHQEQIRQIETLILDLTAQCQARLENQKYEIYETSKRLLKWLVLKEVGDDSYLLKLLEKLILEMNQRQGLIIRVRPADFPAMPSLIEEIEKRLGQLPNVRVEPNPEMTGPGIILETENGILDASTEALMQTIDKLYESVVTHGT